MSSLTGSQTGNVKRQGMFALFGFGRAGYAKSVVARSAGGEPAEKTPAREEIKLSAMLAPRNRNTTAEKRGPRDALSSLDLSHKSRAEVAMWLEEARLDALLGGCRLSMKSLKSGVRCYMAFAESVNPLKKRYFPPELNVLLAWSTMFRSEGTWGNYLGHVKTACVLVKASTQVSVVVKPLSVLGSSLYGGRCLTAQRLRGPE